MAAPPDLFNNLLPAVAGSATNMTITVGQQLLLLVLVLGFLLLLFPLHILSPVAATADLSYPEATEFGVREDLVVMRREEYDEGRILDITHAYHEDMPAGGTEEGLGRFLWLAKSMRNGSLANSSVMKFSVHSGTHVDAPGHLFQHYFDAGFDVDSLDLGVLNGPTLLVDVPRDKNITADVMESLHIPRGVRRVLFRTLNTDRKLMWKKEFDASFVGFMKDGAQWLVDNTDIKLVGIDYVSIAAFDDLIPSHVVFLKTREIIIVESLKLDNIKPGIYSLHCLPLRLRGAEGSPVRCILIK
ncbi:cyclase-like protein 3 [Musa acuminata AAA Group]|uniref:cyclase-like protein 3 n=1 Tax=Musa acuminata AAA Group TaxID=214697 RepID=UPI0031D273F3